MSIDASEKAVVKACLEYLRFKGIVCWRQNTGAAVAQYKGKRRFVRFGVPGISDILGCMPGGRFLAIECKVGKNTPTSAQHHFLEQIRKAGGVAIVARSVDDVVNALATMGVTDGN